MTNFLKNNWIFLTIIAVWLILGYLGLNQIYHQDEHRWAMLADGSDEGIAPHPPVTLIVLKLTGMIFGFDSLRLGTFLFSLLNLVLVYLVSKKLANKAVGLIASILFVVNAYSLIAGLQIDIDGAILPFFVLASYYAYLSFREKKNIISGFVLIILLAGGFLSKLSFFLFFGALILDFILDLYWENKLKFPTLLVIKYSFVTIISGIIFVGLFYYFNSDYALRVFEYGGHFKSLNFGERSYFELGFKVMKAIVWLSPLLLLPVLFGVFKKDLLIKYKFWYIYILANSVFYLVLFDFTKLTIERYFIFTVVPAVIIGARLIYDLYVSLSPGSRGGWMVGAGVFLIFAVFVFSTDYSVLPLNPKTAYLEQIKSFNFNFLIPFTGGSGPIGFYLPAKFILWSWALSAAFLAGAFIGGYRKILFFLFLVFALGYNILLTNEYLTGGLFGSPAKLARKTVNEVISDNKIQEVITYGDIGAYELKSNDKYSARFYTSLSRDYTERMNTYKGHYMIVDFPAIGENDRYWKLLARCGKYKQFTDKKINSYIFDCSNLK